MIGPSKTGTIIIRSEQTDDVDTCSYCHESNTLVSDQFGGMVVCSNCGRVAKASLMDHGPEWKTYEDGGTSTSRCGMPTNALLPQSSLGTTISGNCNYRLKTLHNWGLMPYKERSLNAVLNMIKTKCATAGIIGCVEDDAKILYKIASECKTTSRNCMNGKNCNIIIRGKNRIGLIAACIFYACKRRDCAKSVKEIATLFNIKPSRVNRGCKNFVKYVKYKNIDYSTNLSYPSQYIIQFCEKLKINNMVSNKSTCNGKIIHIDYIKEIITIANNVQKINIVPSHTPISVAAACILLYIIENEIDEIDKRKISEAFDISEVTLMKAYNKIYRYHDVIMNNTSVDKYVNKSKTIGENMCVPEQLSARLRRVNKINTGVHINFNEIKLYKYLNVDIVKYMINTFGQCIEYAKTTS